MINFTSSFVRLGVAAVTGYGVGTVQNLDQQGKLDRAKLTALNTLVGLVALKALSLLGLSQPLFLLAATAATFASTYASTWLLGKSGAGVPDFLTSVGYATVTERVFAIFQKAFL